MSKIKLNLEYFHMPPNKLKSFFKLKNFQFDNIEVYEEKSNIYIYQNTSIIDEYLVSKCMKVKFVFFNTDVVSKISNNEFDNKKLTEILHEIELLSKENISIVFTNSLYPTLFGETTKINKYLAQFLFKTNLDIRFLTFPGEYFAYPIWSNKPRQNKIFATNQLAIKHRMLVGLTEKEIEKTISNATPSSASLYSNKYQVNIRENNRANSLERLIYCCPSCNQFFTLYSEFSCIKCSSCGAAIELDKNGQFLFSKKINSFDDIETFLFSSLSKKGFTDDKLIEYTIKQKVYVNYKKTLLFDIILQIYPEMIIFKNTITKKTTKILFEDMCSVELTQNNTVIIKQKNAKELIFIGKNNENFLILKHLYKLNTN